MVELVTHMVLFLQLERDFMLSCGTDEVLQLRAEAQLPGLLTFRAGVTIHGDHFGEEPEREVERIVRTALQPVIVQLTDQLKDLYMDNCMRHGGQFR